MGNVKCLQIIQEIKSVKLQIYELSHIFIYLAKTVLKTEHILSFSFFIQFSLSMISPINNRNVAEEIIRTKRLNNYRRFLTCTCNNFLWYCGK